MREITIKKTDKTTVKITSPWLSIPDAAAYLGIARSEFYDKVADNVPYKGFGRARRYHVDQLDKYGDNNG
ncbi:MAG TPA: helix-turn-helix domain-containing protein [Candidatus Paceibacterota bacterium]|nr:helix-turn-helix domain-containing protein [Smithellaceae bacterium]HQI26263.1 helix-turn-helix domain-containing protein [Candidatus Paceibacterota bacterium]